MKQINLNKRYYYNSLKAATLINGTYPPGKPTYAGEEGIDPFKHSMVKINGQLCLVNPKTFCEDENLQEVGLIGDEIDQSYKPARNEIIDMYIADNPYSHYKWDIKR